MVSRRNFLNIITMMAVLFFMFLFTQVVKDSVNNYDINEYAISAEKLPDGRNVWTPENEKVEFSREKCVLFCGAKESQLNSVISQWCTYTKRTMLQWDGLSEGAEPDCLPEMILLDASGLDLQEEKDRLLELADRGIPMVFCNLPSTAQIEHAAYFRDMLGIREVRERETEVLGIRLFEGFLIGGGAIYEPKRPEDLKRMDLNSVVPWFVTDSGTKTYMVGLKDEDIVEREAFPCLIWRNEYKGTMVFAVEGDYMSLLTGLGILNAIAYELDSYELYPVVNAQNVVLSNFAGFAPENAERILELYSRTPQRIYQDIIWPGVEAMAESNDLKLTCLFNPQFDYGDGVTPDAEGVVFYLQQLKELRAEAGMTLNFKRDVAVSEVLEQDRSFYDVPDSRYRYQAVYSAKEDLDIVKAQAGQAGVFLNARTVVSEHEFGKPILSYLTEGVTLQYATGAAEKHTYMDDLKQRSLQTALGYSNVLWDLSPAMWPRDEADEWQNLYDNVASNIETYWLRKEQFDCTTLSESDFRVRNLLNLDYKDTRKDSVIELRVSDYEDEAWFLLRTHDEKVTAMRGGDYKKLETNAYLLRVTEQEVTIELSPLSLKELRAE